MKVLGYMFIFLFLGVFLIVSDILFGQITGVTQIRKDARMFKQEVDYTQFTTKNVIPNLSHSFALPHRDEGDALLDDHIPRLFRTNEFGAIDGADNTTEFDNTILFLGGSTTESNEVDEQFRFPFLVEKGLTEMGAKVKTYNFGVRGHTSIDSINILVNRTREVFPDTVILMHGINDRLRLASGRGYSALLGQSQFGSISNVVQRFNEFWISLFDWVSYNSNTIFTLRFGNAFKNAWFNDNRTETRIQGGIKLPSGEINDSPSTGQFITNLKIFIAASKAMGARPILMTQAIGFKNDAQDRFNDAIRHVAQETEVKLIDIAEHLSSSGSWAFFDDGIHLNNEGSIAVSKIIISELTGSSDVPLGNGLMPKKAFVAPTDLAKKCNVPAEKRTFNIGKPWRLGGIKGRYPSISADENWLVYMRREAGLERISLLNLINGQIHPIPPISPLKNDRHPVIIRSTSDAATILLATGWDPAVPDHREELFMVEWPSLTKIRVSPPHVSASIPSYKNNKIYFAATKNKITPSSPNIWMLDTQTKEAVQILSSNDEQWRPVVNGFGQLAFIQKTNDAFDIFLRQQNGAVVNLTKSEEDEWDPSWSPKGDILAFAKRTNENWDVYLQRIRPETHNVRVTTMSSDEWDPTFHPKGHMILFGSANNNGPQLMGVCLFGDAM